MERRRGYLFCFSDLSRFLQGAAKFARKFGAEKSPQPSVRSRHDSTSAEQALTDNRRETIIPLPTVEQCKTYLLQAHERKFIIDIFCRQILDMKMNKIKDPPTPADVSTDAVFKVVVIGASAGGIPALKHILSALPSQFDAAIAIVQHREPKLPGMLAHVLGLSCPFPVQDAEDGESLRPGKVFLAPPNRHLNIGPGGILSLDHSEKIHFVRPSAEMLFRSAAENLKSRVIAVVLSGVGSDGESGVRIVKLMGGTVIAQDEETSEQFGMPQAAIKTGAVDYVLPLASIAPALIGLVTDSGSTLHILKHGPTSQASGA